VPSFDVRRSFILRFSAVGRGAAGAAAGVVALGILGAPRHMSLFLLLVVVGSEVVDHQLLPRFNPKREKPPVIVTRGLVWEYLFEVGDQTRAYLWI
jgi:hypothetical protein